MALNILIVDDSETVRAVIKKSLELAGIPVNNAFQAGNGQEALDLLRDNWIDLVLSDINMPVMNGIELINRMCKDNLLDKIPVIMITTEGSLKRIEALKDKGVRDYIRKPFTPEQLRESVDKLVSITHEG